VPVEFHFVIYAQGNLSCARDGDDGWRDKASVCRAEPA
jgi:hypothetical protein